MNQQHLSTNNQKQIAQFSWNRQRSDSELTTFINTKLAALANVSLVD